MSPLRFCSSLFLLQIARLLSPTRRVQNFTRSCPIVSIRFEKIGERTDLIFIQSFFFFSFHSSKRGRYPAEAADKLFQHAGAVQTHEVSTIYNIRVRSHLKEVEGRRIGSIDSRRKIEKSRPLYHRRSKLLQVIYLEIKFREGDN